MSQFPVRYFIAILTFVMGVSAVSPRHQYQVSQEVRSTPPESRLEPTLQIQENLPDEWEEYFGTPFVWRFLLNDEKYGQIAVVRATGETPSGKVRAELKLACPGSDGPITLIVGDMESSGFNLGNYSIASNLPVLKKNLVAIRAVSPRSELSFNTRANGNIGYDELYPTVIFFELTKTRKLERLIANGSIEVTFVIHDLGSYHKTIKITFPAIRP